MSLYKRGRSWRYNFTVDGERYTPTLGAVSKTQAKEIYAKAKVVARGGKYKSTAKRDDPMLCDFVGEYFAYYQAEPPAALR